MKRISILIIDKEEEGIMDRFNTSLCQLELLEEQKRNQCFTLSQIYWRASENILNYVKGYEEEYETLGIRI